jgi:hypothetical protein
MGRDFAAYTFHPKVNNREKTTLNIKQICIREWIKSQSGITIFDCKHTYQLHGSFTSQGGHKPSNDCYVWSQVYTFIFPIDIYCKHVRAGQMEQPVYASRPKWNMIVRAGQMEQPVYASRPKWNIYHVYCLFIIFRDQPKGVMARHRASHRARLLAKRLGELLHEKARCSMHHARAWRFCCPWWPTVQSQYAWAKLMFSNIMRHLWQGSYISL